MWREAYEGQWELEWESYDEEAAWASWIEDQNEDSSSNHWPRQSESPKEAGSDAAFVDSTDSGDDGYDEWPGHGDSFKKKTTKQITQPEHTHEVIGTSWATLVAQSSQEVVPRLSQKQTIAATNDDDARSTTVYPQASGPLPKRAPAKVVPQKAADALMDDVTVRKRLASGVITETSSDKTTKRVLLHNQGQVHMLDESSKIASGGNDGDVWAQNQETHEFSKAADRARSKSSHQGHEQDVVVPRPTAVKSAPAKPPSHSAATSALAKAESTRSFCE